MKLLPQIRNLPGKVTFSGATSLIFLARNVEGVPFPRHASPIWLEDIVVQVERIFADHFSGKRYKLIHLDDLSPQSLDHFFYEGYIPRGVLTNPRGCVLIHNGMKGVLVNYEDHFRIFSISSDFDLDRIYREVDRIDNLLEEHIDYAFRDDVGYLTSSVARLGTGMNVSFFIHLPALAILYGEDRFGQWLKDKEFNVQGYRGDDGIVGHIYHFSNRYTLGVSEKQTIEILKRFGVSLISWEKQIRTALRNSVARRYELEDNIYERSKRLFRWDDHSVKDVFDFLSLWALAWQEGIFTRKRGLNFIEVSRVLQKICATDPVFKKECIYVLRFFRVISGEDMHHV